jgi:hypothetical protein
VKDGLGGLQLSGSIQPRGIVIVDAKFVTVNHCAFVIDTLWIGTQATQRQRLAYKFAQKQRFNRHGRRVPERDLHRPAREVINRCAFIRSSPRLGAWGLYDCLPPRYHSAVHGGMNTSRQVGMSVLMILYIHLAGDF